MNPEAIEVWDDAQDKLLVFWQVAGNLFPRRAAVAFRSSRAEPLVSALLDCGHVIRAPVAVCVQSPSGRLGWLGCYKCWLAETGSTLAEALAHVLPCSFCGAPHHPGVPCMRPHGAGYFPE